MTTSLTSRFLNLGTSQGFSELHPQNVHNSTAYLQDVFKN